MRNIDVCKAFCNKQEAIGSNLMSTGSKLFSYATCIAQWYGNSIIINDTKYSVTTSKHQSYLKRSIGSYHAVNYVESISRGTQDLSYYVRQC